jgi:hypothetical protein
MVHVWLTGEKLPAQEAVSKRLGLEHVKILGERVGRDLGRPLWHFESPLALTEDLHAHVDAVLTSIEPSAAEFIQLASICEAELSIEAYEFEGHMPDLSLPSSLITRMGRLGLGLWLDVYPE